jgi:hypothetical protein
VRYAGIPTSRPFGGLTVSGANQCFGSLACGSDPYDGRIAYDKERVVKKINPSECVRLFLFSESI